MATFLMIHGSWHGGWSFAPLRAGLEAAGHRLVAPDLPGMGGDAETLAGVSLGGWADFVADLARKAQAPVILCGHSRGGIVISEAAERAPAAIAALVYVTAFLVPSGMSLNDMIERVPRTAEFDAGLAPVEGGAALALSEEGARAAFYNMTPEALRAEACARLVHEPAAPLGTPLSLSDERYGSVPRHYIECSEDRAIPLAQQRDMQRALPVASSVMLRSDHSPFLACPGRLVEELLRIAGTVGG